MDWNHNDSKLQKAGTLEGFTMVKPAFVTPEADMEIERKDA